MGKFQTPEDKEIERQRIEIDGLILANEILTARIAMDKKEMEVTALGIETAHRDIETFNTALERAVDVSTKLVSKRADETTRYCPDCGSVGEVTEGARDCCPDGSHARYVRPDIAKQAHDGFMASIKKPDGINDYSAKQNFLDDCDREGDS